MSGERGGFETWQAQVIDSLSDSKARGLTFEQAWRRATTDHPPRMMDMGRAIPELDDEMPVFEFFREATRDAWLGRRGELTDLPDALRDLGRYWAPTPRPGGRGLLGR